MLTFQGTDRFAIRRCLGSGSFGAVYEAFDRERQTLVALKTPNECNAQSLYLFKQEFRSLANIAHPNLATLYELIAEDRVWFFTMELVDGIHFLDYCRGESPFDSPSRFFTAPTADSSFNFTSDTLTKLEASAAEWSSSSSAPHIQDILRPGLPSPPPDYPRIRAALLQLAQGLCTLHLYGKLHRDIKPSNLLVTRQGRVVILDFGLVTDAHSERESLPRLKQAGTPAYMAPERLDDHSGDESSDWYSVGVVLYQALTGILPFEGTSCASLRGQMEQAPADPGEKISDIPADLRTLCAALLRCDPTQRPSGREVLRRLCALAPEQAPPELPPPGPSNLLVGRQEELQTLLEAFHRIRRQEGATVFLQGESGMGKTFLIRRFVKEVKRIDPSAIILQGRCYEQETVPFKGFDSLVDALSQHMKGLPTPQAEALLPPHAHALARLFPVLNQIPCFGNLHPPQIEVPDVHVFRRRAFDALRKLLTTLGTQSPLVLVIDDLHWGDLDSAHLIAELLRPPHPPPLMLLLGFRAEERESAPILRALLERPPEGLPGRVDIHIHRLPLEEAQRLALARLGSDAPEAQTQAAWIARESGGSPFFTEELARHCAIPHRNGEAIADLDDYLRHRISNLPPDAKRALEVLSLAGYPMSWDILRQAAGLEGGGYDALVHLKACRLIRSRSLARRKLIETHHDRIRETAAAMVDAPTAQAIHLRIASILETSGALEPQALAMHFQAGGSLQKAASYAYEAAQIAESSLAFERAAELYRQSMALRSPLDPQMPELWNRLGEALANAGRSAEAAEAFLQTARSAPARESVRLYRKAAEEYFRSGNVDEGTSVLQRVLSTVGTALPRTPARAMLSILFRRLRLRIRGYRFILRPAPSIPPAILDKVDIYWAAAMGLGPVDILRGADFQTRQLLLTLAAGEPFRVVRALAHEAIFLSSSGIRSQKATARLLAITLSLAEEIGHPNPLARAYIASGIAAEMQGRWKAATELLEKAEQLLQQHCRGMDYELHIAQHHAMLNRSVLGDLSCIRERLPAILEETRSKGDLMGVTNLRTALDHLLSLAEDAPDRAREELQHTMAAWSQSDFHAQHFLALVARINIELYAGNYAAAWNYLQQQDISLQRSMLLRIQTARITILELQGRISLALFAVSPHAPQAGAWLQDARRAIRSLRRQKTDYGDALALKLQGLQAALQGKNPKAQGCFLQAAIAFEACGMALHAAIAQRCRGCLQGTSSTHTADADTWMRKQGIRNPQRFAAMHVPGLRST